MVHSHCQDILSVLEVRGQVIHERHVSVWTFAEKLSVKVHFAAVIDAFEIDVVSRCVVVHREMLAVPTDAGGKISRAACECRGETPFYGPVVRKVECAPIFVIERIVFLVRSIGEAEQPAVIEFHCIAERGLCLCRNAGQC